MNIAVYCSARNGISPAYFDDARKLGTWIGSHGHALVYGGLAYALMEEVAQATNTAGGKVIGVVPQARADRASQANTVNIHVCDLAERKAVMDENADCFVALEGGIGTLDEVFSALAQMMFSDTSRPIILLNRDGIYAPLKPLLDGMRLRGLCNSSAIRRLTFVDTVEQLISTLENL